MQSDDDGSLARAMRESHNDNELDKLRNRVDELEKILGVQPKTPSEFQDLQKNLQQNNPMFGYKEYEWQRTGDNNAKTSNKI